MTPNGSRTPRHLSFANVVSLLALFVALGGTVYAAATIGAGDIKRNAVRAKHIKSGNVKRADIANNAVNAAKIAGGSVGSSEIAAGAVTAAKLNAPAQWSNVTYATGWGPYDAAPINFNGVQCYRDPFGIVHLRGATERLDGTATTTIATLPEACRTFPSSPLNVYASFAGVTLDNTGYGIGDAALWLGVEASGNLLGTDSLLPPIGSGFSVDGAAIGAR